MSMASYHTIHEATYVLTPLSFYSTPIVKIKMKSAIAATLVGSAVAFAPAQTGKVSTALNGDARSPDGLGVDPGPLDLFDPLGLMEDTDSFPRRRAVEIKHGRISMVRDYVGSASSTSIPYLCMISHVLLHLLSSNTPPHDRPPSLV